MNKDNFFTIDVDKRAEDINQLLQTSDLKGVSTSLDIPYSTFTKEMQKGDYVYIARENKYFKFIRDGNSVPTSKTLNRKSEEFTAELTFLRDNLNEIKGLLDTYCTTSQTPLVLNKEIYDTKAKFVNKNIKVNEAIYDRFSRCCNSTFPQYRIQDLIAHCFLMFINKYETP